jgi:lipid-A-disaccharide synthase
MKYYVIAGEASGDLHGSNLIKALLKDDPSAEFRCWGGDMMENAGATVVKHYRDLAFMGFFEVIANLRTILKNIRICKEDIIGWKPDAVIFIDYPGFNLRIAQFVKQLGIPTMYYISPQIWAWKSSRVKQIKRDIDRMLVILPFEQDFYLKHGMKVDFVGHPLLDALASASKPDSTWKKNKGIPEDIRLIALLPGSRKQEIEAMLPIMMEATRQMKNAHFLLAVAPSQPLTIYENLIGDRKDVNLIQGETYSVLSSADAALVTSGTATLETALFGVPQVVCYKGNRISYWIARKLIKIRFISLVNLIMDKEVVRELIQDELNPVNLRKELDRLFEESYRKSIEREYGNLKEKLGGPGASEKSSKLIINHLKGLNKP